MSTTQIERMCAAERAAVCDLADQPLFRAALIRTADNRHRFVVTIHHIVIDGWSLPVLLQEIFASYLRAAAARGPRRIAASSPGWPVRIATPRKRRGARCWPASTRPPWSARRTVRAGQRGVESYRVSAETTQALGELARSQHTTVNTVLQAAWAQLLMWLTGHHDVAFGTAVSGRPADLPGAESMVGLLINTVPVRANITAATTIADLLDQLQRAHNDTLEHEHLALREIHRVTGHDQLFDTLFVYENYPIDTGALLGVQELADHRVQQPRVQPLPAVGGGDAGPRTGPARRIRHRGVRRGRRRSADRRGCGRCWWP